MESNERRSIIARHGRAGLPEFDPDEPFGSGLGVRSSKAPIGALLLARAQFTSAARHRLQNRHLASE